MEVIDTAARQTFSRSTCSKYWRTVLLTLATSGADLSGAVLCEVRFPIANLGRANLSRTDVGWAIRQTDLLETTSIRCVWRNTEIYRRIPLVSAEACEIMPDSCAIAIAY